MKIGILQTGHAPHQLRGTLGDYEDMFRRLLGGYGFEFQTWNVVDGSFPIGLIDADGWLVTGSKHGAYEDHPWIPPLESLIRDIQTAGHPLVGVCFGHQIIAQALGGTVEKFKDGWATGAQTYEMADGGTMTLNAWHQDQVIELPPNARVLATNAFCAHAALAIGETILTVQPHPEFDKDVIAGLLEYRAAGVVPDNMISDTKARLDTPTDGGAFGEKIAQFFISHNREGTS